MYALLLGTYSSDLLWISLRGDGLDGGSSYINSRGSLSLSPLQLLLLVPQEGVLFVLPFLPWTMGALGF